jgi:NarL family two-component system response regulator LiaR
LLCEFADNYETKHNQEKEPNMDKNIRILIVDDHPIVRGGLRTMINSEPGMQVVGEAVDGDQAVSSAFELQPDVILMDIVMPHKDGIAATSDIIKGSPKTRILILSSFDDEYRVLLCIKAGAAGYLLKESTPEELIQAIREVHAGRKSLPAPIVDRLMQALSHDSSTASDQDELTERENEVIRCVAKGASNKEIAEKLNISERTVIKHISNIMNKLNLTNRTQIALYAVRMGMANAN